MPARPSLPPLISGPRSPRSLESPAAAAPTGHDVPVPRSLKVEILTFKDVNIEELAKNDLEVPKP